MLQNSQESLILYCHDTEQLFLFMAVFGIAIQSASMLLLPQPELVFGLLNLQEQ